MEQHAVLQRFVAASEADPRISAAFLGGSFASETADAYSDLDLYLVIADASYDDFFAERQVFMRCMGQPVFFEDFNNFGFDMLLFTFADGVEGELALGKVSHFDHIHGGPFKALVDKPGLLSGKVFPLLKLKEVDQQQTLHRLIYWFWENVSQFITAMHRKRIWMAYGALEEMRLKCLNLACLQHDYTAPTFGYTSVDHRVPEQELYPLLESFCAPEFEAMYKSVRVIIAYYRQIALALAAQHGEIYPHELEQVLSNRLEKLSSFIQNG